KLAARGAAWSFPPGPRRRGPGRQLRRPLPRPLPFPLPPEPFDPPPPPPWASALRLSASSFFSASYMRLIWVFRVSSAREVRHVVQVRNDGEHRQLEIVLDLLLEAQSSIEELDRHRRRRAENESGKETEHQRYPGRILRVDRRDRPVDHAPAHHTLPAHRPRGAARFLALPVTPR